MKRVWIAAALAVTLLFGIVYIAVQQSLRLGANDPQTAMAQDAAASINNNRKPSDLFSGRIEIAYSMAPFIIVYDKMGNVVAGNGYLNGEIPVMPFGVLQHTPANGTHAVTWEPASGVRIASVSIASRDYYVVSGRSLEVVESHIQTITQYMFSIWLLVLAGLAAAFLVVNRAPIKPKS